MKRIRESKITKITVYYLMMTMILQIIQPTQVYALTSGPSQPEFSSFTPIETSDMVDLSTGDYNYNIPVMDVGGYPINLAYNSGVTMEQEASWVGLGWDMSVGQINRQVRGLPDDFDGDAMIYENNMRPNVTIGAGFNVFLAPFGLKENIKPSVGLGIKYNNYDGFGISVEGGLTFSISKNLSIGMNLESSSTDGVTASPNVSFHAKHKVNEKQTNDISANFGVSLNSRKGLETMSLSASASKEQNLMQKAAKEYAGGGSTSSSSISFVNSSFTPTKRTGMYSSNYMFALNIEGAVFGVDPGFKISGYRNYQGIKDSEKYKEEKGYGYEFTENATANDVLDFNREKDRTVNKNTISLPLTNYTYDLYSIQGQGIGGMFRPYRSQVGMVFDNYKQDDSDGGNLGVEIGAGAGFHFGVDGAYTSSDSDTGPWVRGNGAYSRMTEKKTGNAINYEKVYFKNIGGNHVDKEAKNLFDNNLDNYNPIAFKLGGSEFSRTLESNYYDKYLSRVIPGSGAIKRERERVNRNQTIQKLNRTEALNFGSKYISPFSNTAQNKHTTEIRIIKDNGDRYNYGRAAYNVVKKEVTFDVGTTPRVDCKTNLVTYSGNDNTRSNNQSNSDQFFNGITTPAYAHSYLLTSIVSSDYQDLTSNGPTDDDLGTYTKFSYDEKTSEGNLYKWRFPYGTASNQANYDEGLRSLEKDNKGSYQYGEKEMLYIKEIKTKTHIAIFSISPRKDGLGSLGENGGKGNNAAAKMWKLDKISLYSRPEYDANGENAVPIKVAYFEYDYSLCPGVYNHEDFNVNDTGLQKANKGKLTLKKVYFTYRNSKMGKYTPYVFNYNQETNYAYDSRGFDIWGNYKPSDNAVGCGTQDALSNAEYPYVNQANKENADKYASAWSLQSIDLPSGGQMELTYESDDYKYVQDKQVMQMFKVIGSGINSNPQNPFAGQSLYTNSPVGVQNEPYLYIELDKECANTTEFKKKYIEKLANQLVYFRFLLNMTNPGTNSDKYDYVTGYLDIDESNLIGTNSTFAAIKVKTANRGDGIGQGEKVHPISKAGWYFGRQNLNKVMYNLTGNEDVNNVEGVIRSILDLLPNLVEIFKSPNSQLIERGIASNFIPNKSWIRLMQPEELKLGGGCRVKEIKIHDNWDVMTSNKGEEIYQQFYGQQYSYKTQYGESAGVATYEPLGSKENPHVYPFFDNKNRDVPLGPDNTNYVELPMGESFFPSPKITYSRVTVKNLPREKTDANEVKVVKKHATGSTVTEFYTSKEYPTSTDFSKVDPKYDQSILSSIFNTDVKTHLSLAQGFAVHTNDMNGKMKAQWVYPEGQTDAISGMEYKYEVQEDKSPIKGKLDNEIITIDAQGKIAKNVVGVDYDVINDFRLSKSVTETSGIQFNTEGLPLFLVFLVVPIPLPNYARHENLLKMATTTKTIHSSGILRETVAYDLSSRVSTKNIAWDANTGEILVTQTVNEYNDNYYSFNFPAYWAYDGMNQAALNLGIESNISPQGQNDYKLEAGTRASDYLIDGDQVWITTPENKRGFKAWIVDVKATTFKLINKDGMLITSEEEEEQIRPEFITSGTMKIIYSGRKNSTMASMASITMMNNPLYEYVNGKITTTLKTNLPENPFLSNTWSDNRIVNASAIEFKEQWAPQCECGFPKLNFDDEGKLLPEYMQDRGEDPDQIKARSYNPYRFNVMGNWRPVASHAYLTGRNNITSTPRISGFFNDFRSFYVRNATTKKWQQIAEANRGKWTFASAVTQFNTNGQEVENKDALDRFSAAIYGYNYRFPVAVASNAKYSEVATDGFEDYDFEKSCKTNTHFNFIEKLVPNKVTVTNKEAHTGRKSIKLEPNASVKLNKKVASCANKKALTTNPQQ
jgi:hypothetical protein